jgi:outer membrane protein
MKNFLRFTPILVLLFFFQANALGADPLKIGVLNMQKFQANSKAMQAETQKLQKKYDDMKNKLDEEVKDLQKLEEELKKQSLMLSLDAQSSKRREVERKQRYIQFLRNDFSQEMKDTDQENSQRILKELEKIVGKIAKDGGYTLILERKSFGLIYADESIDITDEVVKAYDKMKK